MIRGETYMTEDLVT